MEKPHIAFKKPIVIECEPGTYYWCQCGLSNDQPYCDGSHKGGPFSPIKEEIFETKRVAWCACKQSAKAPHCDGSHKQL